MRIMASQEELNKLELSGLSEQKIADKLGCSRMTLYKYRKRNNCLQLMRSDRGTERKAPEEKKANYNAYHRAYPTKTRNNRRLRKIVLQVLGRRLKQGEVIHHIDGNPHNNQHNNLVICTQSYHMSVLHADRSNWNKS